MRSFCNSIHSEPQQAEAVNHIVTAGRHITALLEEFLDIARIEAGAIAVELTPLSARTAAIEAVQMSMPLAAERAITIKGSGDDHVILADAVRLRQVLLNLLSNAIKYNREGGSIFVQVARDETTTILSVTDTGNGIPDDQLPRLFIPFDRLDADRTTVKGTGVGLAVVKQLVELMHGLLTVEAFRHGPSNPMAAPPRGFG